MEQFAGLFIIVAFVLWLAVFVPNRVRAKFGAENAGYDDKFSTGVRVLADIKRQIRDYRQESLRAEEAEEVEFNTSNALRALPTQSMQYARPQKSVENTTTIRNLHSLRPQNKRQKGGISLQNLLCSLLLVGTIATWVLFGVLPSLNVLFPAVTTLFYCVALLCYHLPKMRAQTVIKNASQSISRASRGVAKSQAEGQQVARQMVRQPAERKLVQLRNRRLHLGGAEMNTANSPRALARVEDELLMLRTQNFQAQKNFDEAKVVVADFTPHHYKSSQTVQGALLAQMNYAQDMMGKFDEELTSIDIKARTYKERR
jgi:hypothetical protein